MTRELRRWRCTAEVPLLAACESTHIPSARSLFLVCSYGWECTLTSSHSLLNACSSWNTANWERVVTLPLKFLVRESHLSCITESMSALFCMCGTIVWGRTPFSANCWREHCYCHISIVVGTWKGLLEMDVWSCEIGHIFLDDCILHLMCHIDLFWFRISNFRCMQNWIKIL